MDQVEQQLSNSNEYWWQQIDWHQGQLGSFDEQWHKAQIRKMRQWISQNNKMLRDWQKEKEERKQKWHYYREII